MKIRPTSGLLSKLDDGVTVTMTLEEAYSLRDSIGRTALTYDRRFERDLYNQLCRILNP